MSSTVHDDLSEFYCCRWYQIAIKALWSSDLVSDCWDSRGSKKVKGTHWVLHLHRLTCSVSATSTSLWPVISQSVLAPAEVLLSNSPEPQSSTSLYVSCSLSHIVFGRADTMCVCENVKRVHRVVRSMIGFECEVSSWSGLYKHSVAATVSNLGHDKDSLVWDFSWFSSFVLGESTRGEWTSGLVKRTATGFWQT